MYSLILRFTLPSVAVVTASPPRAHELDASYTFSQYLSHFRKSYPDPDDYLRRSRLFESNLRKILDHNEGRMVDGRVTKGYVMGVNAFTDQEEGEVKMGFDKMMHPAWSGQLKKRKENSIMSEMEESVRTERWLGGARYSRPPSFEVEPVSSLPASVDWSHLANSAPSQGSCGSCWAFASTACIESHLALATNSSENLMELSVVNVMHCTPNVQECGGAGGCSGATYELAWDYIADLTSKNNGGMYRAADLEGYMPQDESCSDIVSFASPVVGIDGWTVLPTNNYTMVMNALAKVGPLAVAVAADSWAAYESGIFYTSATTINHAVLLVGYGTDESTGEKYYLIRNSWGGGWGENGYVRLYRGEDESNKCAMDEEPLIGIACALDENGNPIKVDPVQVCGESGVLFDVAYPVGVHMLGSN